MNNESSPVESRQITVCAKADCVWRQKVSKCTYYCPFASCENAMQKCVEVAENEKPVIDTRKPKPRERLLEYNGEIHNVTEWAKILGISYDTIYARFKKGWSVEETLSTTPLRKRVRKNVTQSKSV